MARTIIVISAERIDLLPELSREFGGEDVSVLIDRRQSERRQRREDRQDPSERRRERRVHDVSAQLEEFGFAVIAIP